MRASCPGLTGEDPPVFSPAAAHHTVVAGEGKTPRISKVSSWCPTPPHLQAYLYEESSAFSTYLNVVPITRVLQEAIEGEAGLRLLSCTEDQMRRGGPLRKL
jgi:hypothetical protein